MQGEAHAGISYCGDPRLHNTSTCLAVTRDRDILWQFCRVDQAHEDAETVHGPRPSRMYGWRVAAMPKWFVTELQTRRISGDHPSLHGLRKAGQGLLSIPTPYFFIRSNPAIITTLPGSQKSRRLVLIPPYTQSPEHSAASASDIIVDNIIKIIVHIIATRTNRQKRLRPFFSERFILIRFDTTRRINWPFFFP
ncbi:hypothetical protein TMatcc_001026 [Talaromyces marneffei ATCC 18224]